MQRVDGSSNEHFTVILDAIGNQRVEPHQRSVQLDQRLHHGIELQPDLDSGLPERFDRQLFTGRQFGDHVSTAGR